LDPDVFVVRINRLRVEVFMDIASFRGFEELGTKASQFDLARRAGDFFELIVLVPMLIAAQPYSVAYGKSDFAAAHLCACARNQCMAGFPPAALQ